MRATIGQPAPNFSLMGVVNEQFKEVKLEHFLGKKRVVLLFYPGDFTFVCPTEILAFSSSIEEFRKRDTVVLGISVDSIYTHRAWARVDPQLGGVKGVAFPLLSDIKKEVCEAYGCLMEESGQALRGVFIINTRGILKHMSIHHNDIGRSVAEVLRVLDAIDNSEKHGVVCPANWEIGKATLKAE